MVKSFGKSGVGKSHLIESLQNALSAEGFVSRRHFIKFSNNAWIIDSHEVPIVLVDDWFSELSGSDRSFGDEQTRQIAKVLQYVYEHKVLLITGSNFDIMGDPNLAKRIAAFDTTGRLRSRMEEFANGQIEMIVPDYRTTKEKWYHRYFEIFS